MTLPPPPTLSAPRTLSVTYYTPDDMAALDTAWHDRDAALLARIAELEAQLPQPDPTVFSFDIGDIALTPDAPLSEGKKIADHERLLQTEGVQNVRVFFGGDLPRWNDARILALGATDSMVISTLSRDRAGLAGFLSNTPEWFRLRPGQVKLAHGHEQEAQWKASGKSATWLRGWLDGNAEKADLLHASPVATQSEDDLAKILLHYSQHHDTALKNTREVFHGGQDFGIFGEDCYHYQGWLSLDRYETPEELFGGIVDFCKQSGRPCAIPEWGGTRAKTDTAGVRRAQAITDGAAYLRANGVVFANWWCAYGRLLDGVRLNHHLDIGGAITPEVAAYRALV